MKVSCWPSIFVAFVLLATSPLAKDARAQTAQAGVEAAFTAILAHPKVIKTLGDIKADDARTLAEQKRITPISARRMRC